MRDLTRANPCISSTFLDANELSADSRGCCGSHCRTSSGGMLNCLAAVWGSRSP